MSIYRRAGATTYSFDFRSGGRRFSGDTGKTSKREAVAEERLRREGALLEVKQDVAMDAPKTWELAASRYWLEVGQHHKNAETTLTSLDWLTRHIGKHTPLRQIDDNRVAALVAERRVELRRVGSDRASQRPIAPATVNRTMTEPLRKVLLRASNVWKVPSGDITWRLHLLREPKERVREASPGEEARILSRLAPGYEDAMRFAFLCGCRRMEIIGLAWTDVDFFGRQFTLHGKGDKSRTIPMSDAIHDLLWRQRGRHPTAVFAFEARRTSRLLGQIRGQLYPMTDSGLRTAARRAMDKAAIVDFRFHDTRHTAATRVLRTSNLRVVQILLGHEDVNTTTKYAHALAEDVRAALNAASPTKTATVDQGMRSKNLK